MKRTTFIALLCLACCVNLFAQNNNNITLREDNIDEVIAVMTNEEKVALLVGARGELVPGAAGYTCEIARLGIPMTVLADGPAGLRIQPKREGTDQTFYCTGFPTSTLLASSWDPEVVELYVAAPSGGLEKPARELRAFAKTQLLAPGESETLTMKVSAYEMASFNEERSAWETAAGTYQVLFGASVADIRTTSNFKFKKAQTWEAHDVLGLQTKEK